VLLDEGVPIRVGKAFEEAEHEVIYFKEALETGSADDIVAITAVANSAILIACDGDMRAMAKKFGVSNTRFKNLSLIKITLKSKARAYDRTLAAMSLIEHEWGIANQKVARRMFIDVSENVIRTHR
jgi:predicted nuclease of predicted toxin-antitoxin system